MTSPSNAEEARAWLEQHQIKYVLAQFVDIHGSAKAKAVPAEHLRMVLEEGAGFAAFAIWGMGMGPEGADYMAVGDPTTLAPMPWMPGYARIACDGHVKGQPYPLCSRVALKRQVAELEKRGLTLFTGMEPEFMLLARGEGGRLVPAESTDTLEKPCYDYKGLARSSAYLERLVDAVKPAGLDVDQIDHEDANGQFEINFTYADCMKTADRMVFFKMAASEVARRGLRPLAWLGASATAGVAPRIMGIGPVPATRKLVERLGIKVSDFDLIELNEAFASQGIACLRQLGVKKKTSARASAHA
jgi:glutamine synthetase